MLCDPCEHVDCRRARRATCSRNTELDERDEPPVGAFPFAVRVHPKTTVASLARQQSGDRRLPPRRWRLEPYSHSMVPGGLLVMSKTTRLTPLTSLTIRLLIRARTSYGTRAQSAVIASSLVTTRTATTFAYVL